MKSSYILDQKKSEEVDKNIPYEDYDDSKWNEIKPLKVNILKHKSEVVSP